MHLRRLRPVLEEKGPFTTLHVEVGRAAEDAQDRADARWTRLRHDLESAGTAETLIEDIGARVRAKTHLPGEVWRTIVATGDRVVFDDTQPGHNPHGEVLDHGALPDFAAWLDHADQAFPFVLAVADRTGADVSAHRAVGAREIDAESVTGETFYVTKVAEGDWAQKQFQRSAENAWVHNARLVADAVRSLAAEHGCRAALVAGEVRARAELRRALEEGEHQHLGPIVDLERGGRAAGTSTEALWDEVGERIKALSAEADTDIADLLDEARTRGEGAATGLDEVLDALAKAQVRRLVVDLEAMREVEADTRKHPGLSLPDADGGVLSADRVLVAAAARTDAELTLLPASIAHGGGVSALLRWSD